MNEHAIKEMTRKSYRSNQIALKWGKRWYEIYRKRKVKSSRVSTCEKENMNSFQDRAVGANKLDSFDFYKEFRALKTKRPAPKIPSFYAQKKYLC